MPASASAAAPASGSATPTSITWGHQALTAEIGVRADRTVELTLAGGELGLPLTEMAAPGHGSGWSGPRLVHNALGTRLRYRSHTTSRDGDLHHLTVELHDEESGLTAEVRLSSPDGVPVLRSRLHLRNDGTSPVRLDRAASLVVGGLGDPRTLDVHRARNQWLAECRWHSEPLGDTLVDFSRPVHEHDSAAGLTLVGRGSWPTSGYLPMGAVVSRETGRCHLWQVESAADWRWDLAELEGSAALFAYGPLEPLAPGEEFTTVPAAIAIGDGFEGALAALTAYRRAVRRPHSDHQKLPVIFNDYMNTLMGDPTTAKLLPLIDAAADVGAEYFCIDSGWYDDSAEGWWDSVGEWLPASSRFPDGGIQRVIGHIRERGMVPGLWLEPEVVGVHSPMAAALPDAAFLRRDGVRITEFGRHQLDLRHSAARAHLDATIDRIVGDWGVGYLKLDYNIAVESADDGLAGHARAYLDWLCGVLDRHPALVVENCASGGMRMDGASLAVSQLQSTSDQQDAVRYPPIAAAAPTAVPPEQSAVWAYPQHSFTDEEITFTLGNALLGRIHLSGHLNRMTARQTTLVRQAIEVYKSIRHDLPEAVPFWPLGLPAWDDDWLALGLRTRLGTEYVSVWRRGGTETAVLPLGGPGARVDILHPLRTPAEVAWQKDGGALTVRIPLTPAAVLLQVTPAPEDFTSRETAVSA